MSQSIALTLWNSAIKSIPGQTDLPLLHLRRFAKADFVPERVRALTSTVSSCTMNDLGGETLALEDSDAKQDCEETMHVLLCPTKIISQPDLSALIARTLQGFRAVKVVATTVPLYAPTSLEQAAAKSAKYWPTVFLNGNPFGPHPSLVTKAQLELESSASAMMSLASTVGRESQARGVGCGAGVVVTERTALGTVEVIAAAGDGRWIDGMGKGDASGSPGGHAVMRAIALVAKKRRQLAMSNRFDEGSRKDIFAGEPLTALEQHHFEQGKLVANGYLCLNLEFWITHEPCTMCCMAMLHSRVGRIVYGQRMQKTGAMKVDCLPRPSSPPGLSDGAILREVAGNARVPEAAGDKVGMGKTRSPSPRQLDAGERGLEYGLFWRDDLNWRFMCWQWIDASSASTLIDADTQI